MTVIEYIDDHIKKEISFLSYEWFKEKLNFYTNEDSYDRIDDIISVIVPNDNGEVIEDSGYIVFSVDVLEYCWNAIFDTSTAYRLLSSEEHFKAAGLPIDSSEVADHVLQIINEQIKLYTDATAIDIIITHVVGFVIEQIEILKQKNNNLSYHNVLIDFIKRLRELFTKTFQHVLEQIELKTSINNNDRKLTATVCAKIADFKIMGKKFITNLQGPLNLGDALLYALSPDPGKQLNIKLWVTDWNNLDVYYLLIRISEIINGGISITQLEKKKVLYVKKEKLFVRNSFYVFKNQELSSYIAKGKNLQLDAQIASLF